MILLEKLWPKYQWPKLENIPEKYQYHWYFFPYESLNVSISDNSLVLLRTTPRLLQLTSAFLTSLLRVVGLGIEAITSKDERKSSRSCM